MTLVAYAVKPDKIEILSDSLTYSPRLEVIGAGTKVRLFPHLDVAVASGGSGQFVQAWLYALGMEAHDRPVRDFDSLHEKAIEWLPTFWRQLPETERLHQAGSIVMHLGWSPSAGRMRATRYHVDDDGLTVDDDDAWYTLDPAPFGIPGPRFGPPQSTGEWVRFAEQVQALYARPNVPTIPIGGPLILTELRRGEARQRRIGMLDDSEAYWRAVIEMTLHPAAIADTVRAEGVDPTSTPCPCGSGAALADCHLARAVDRPLAGLSGYPPVAAPVKVGRNDPCPCGSGRKFKICCLSAA